MADEVKPSIREAFRNLRGPMPFPRKVRLLLANNWKKIRTRQNCCGNYSQPGC